MKITELSALAALLCFGFNIGVYAESIVNGGFADASGWSIMSQEGSSVTIVDGVASIHDSGDSKKSRHAQALYQDFSSASGTVDFSFDFRLDSAAGSTMRIALYSGAGGYNSGDVFRCFLGLNKKSGETRFTVTASEKNKSTVNVGTAGLDTWIRVAGSVDLVKKISSGKVTSQDGSTVYGSWSGIPTLNPSASSVEGFAVYDVASAGVSGDLSFDNISVTQ